MKSQELRFRLAAILAADAVAYSRLMAADARETIEALDKRRHLVRVACLEFFDSGRSAKAQGRMS